MNKSINDDITTYSAFYNYNHFVTAVAMLIVQRAFDEVLAEHEHAKKERGTMVALTMRHWFAVAVLALFLGTVALSLRLVPRTPEGLSVQQVVTLESTNTPTTLFVAGEVIHYGVLVKKWGSTTLPATLTVVATGPRQLFSWSGPVAAGRATSSFASRVPPDAPSGTYTLTGTLNDKGVRSAQSSQFQVAGSLSVPYSSQRQGQPSQELDCGPTAVMMLLQYYHHSPAGTSKDQLTQIRDIIEAQFPDGNHMDVTNAQELEYSLSYYGKSSSAISLILTPSTATHVMEQMIAQGQPSIAFLDGTVLERPYAGHWVVVTGFSFDGQDDYVHLNDPDSNASGGYPGHPTVLKLSDFQQAGQSGTIKQWQPYGIIVPA